MAFDFQFEGTSARWRDCHIERLHVSHDPKYYSLTIFSQIEIARASDNLTKGAKSFLMPNKREPMSIFGAFARQFPEIGHIPPPQSRCQPHLLILNRVSRPHAASASIQLRVRWPTVSLFKFTLWTPRLLIQPALWLAAKRSRADASGKATCSSSARTGASQLSPGAAIQQK